MRFGAKEVMVIAALTFGVMIAGCSTAHETSAAFSTPRHIASEVHECKVCIPLSLHESGNPDTLDVLNEEAHLKLIGNALVAGGPGAADFDCCYEPVLWSLSLPRFFK